ncbi:MAG: carboxypeptidase regulatory-like domain-containing protein [Planctomycetes bacterium]|nr:carboxypeptidase regulatory-like domain-containing protein [Planctomycetota bacterium]
MRLRPVLFVALALGITLPAALLGGLGVLGLFESDAVAPAPREPLADRPVAATDAPAATDLPAPLEAVPQAASASRPPREPERPAGALPAEPRGAAQSAGLESRTDAVLASERGATLSGFVRYTDGAPAAGASIWLLAATGSVRRREQSGADGSYRFSALPAGRYFVEVVAPSRRHHARVPAAILPGGVLGAAAGPALALAAGEHAVRDFTVERGVRVEGVVRAEGAPVIGAQVAVRLRVAPRALPAVRAEASAGDDFGQARTDAEGRYAIVNVAPGPGEVTVHVEDPRQRYLALRRVLEIPRTDRFVLDLELPTGSIEGRVFRPAAAEARSDALHRLRLRRTDGPDPSIRLGAAESDGTYRFAHLAPGTYEVTVVGGRDWAPMSRADLVVGPGAAVTGIELQLESGTSVEGVVVDENGSPVEDARVRAELGSSSGAFPSTPYAEARTDAGGRFTMRHLRPGPHRFWAMKLRRHSATLEIPVLPDGATRVRLVLDRGVR